MDESLYNLMQVMCIGCHFFAIRLILMKVG